MKKLVLLLSLLFIPCISQAATGDLLFNCTFEGTNTKASEVVTACGAQQSTIDNTAKIVLGAGHDGGNAISWYYPNQGGETGDLLQVSNLNKSEITIVYWEKFDEPESRSDIWNTKSIRVYSDTNHQNYLGAVTGRWNNGQWYQSFWENATLTTTPNVSWVNDDAKNFCSGGGSTWNCPNRFSMSLNPVWGTSWRKVRMYLKAPSSATSADGISKVWLDENLLFTLTNVKPDSKTPYSPYFTDVTFHPSDDFFQGGVQGNRFTFNHLYDDITVYEGYVPPQTGGAQALQAPSGLKILSK